ncbi:MAG: head-tail connector protein [Pikeienuella sp.]
MALRVVSEPAVEPLTLDQAKAALRVVDSAEDDLITALIVSARRSVEARVRHRLITQTVELTLDQFGATVPLPVWPVQSVQSVEYNDSAGADQTLASSAYRLVTSGKPARLAPVYQGVWPTVRADFDAVRIQLVVGYGDAASAVPADLVAALRLVLGDLYENRQGFVYGSVSKIPFGAEQLIAPHIFWV